MNYSRRLEGSVIIFTNTYKEFLKQCPCPNNSRETSTSRFPFSYEICLVMINYEERCKTNTDLHHLEVGKCNLSLYFRLNISYYQQYFYQYHVQI